MSLLLEMLQTTFYMPLLLVIMIVISIPIQVKSNKNEIYRWPMIIYSVSFFIVVFFGSMTLLVLPDKFLRTQIQEIANASFAVIEFTLFTFYFHKLLANRIVNVLIFISYLILLALYGVFIKNAIENSTTTTLLSLNDKLVSYEMVILTLLSLSFYYKILKETTNKSLLNSPSFWIVTGLFFYSIVSAPFFTIGIQLLMNNIKLYNSLYAIHYLFATILFINITKAFLCNRSLIL